MSLAVVSAHPCHLPTLACRPRALCTLIMSMDHGSQTEVGDILRCTVPRSSLCSDKAVAPARGARVSHSQRRESSNTDGVPVIAVKDSKRQRPSTLESNEQYGYWSPKSNSTSSTVLLCSRSAIFVYAQLRFVLPMNVLSKRGRGLSSSLSVESRTIAMHYMCHGSPFRSQQAAHLCIQILLLCW